jgi:hypothetical membrane protein
MTIKQYFVALFVTSLMNIALIRVFDYESEHAMILSMITFYFIMLEYKIIDIKKRIINEISNYKS